MQLRGCLRNRRPALSIVPWHVAPATRRAFCSAPAKTNPVPASTSRVDLVERSGHGCDVAAMSIDEQKALEPVLHQRGDYVAYYRDQRGWPQRDGSGEAQVMLRHADRQSGRDQGADRIADALGDEFCIEVVGADQAVRSVLLGRANGDDDAARAAQVLFNFMPGG